MPANSMTDRFYCHRDASKMDLGMMEAAFKDRLGDAHCNNNVKVVGFLSLLRSSVIINFLLLNP